MCKQTNKQMNLKPYLTSCAEIDHVLKTDHIPKYGAKIIILLELNKTILVIWGLAKIS